MTSLQFSLSILLFHQDGEWVAQCLQHDIAEQGKTIPEALKNFEAVFLAHVDDDLDEGREPLQLLPEAPAKFWKMFEDAEPLQSQRPFRTEEREHATTQKRAPRRMIRATASELRVC